MGVVDRVAGTQKAWVQITAQPWKFTGGVEQAKPLLKYLTYRENSVRVTIGQFQVDATKQHHNVVECCRKNLVAL